MKGSRERESEELVSSMRHGRDGELLPKQRHVEGENGGITRIMNIEDLIINGPSVSKENKVTRQMKATNKGQIKQLAAANTLTKRVVNYDLLSSLAQANL